MPDSLRTRRASNDSTAATAGADAWALILLCECGRPDCESRVALVLEEHRRARALGAHIVAPAHEHVAGGTVVERHERYVLVAPGDAPLPATG